MLQVAVKLPSTSEEVGEYLADVVALEAAGAAALWIDAGGLDPWVLLGAMAALTHRIRLGCMLESDPWPPEAVATLQKLSRGRALIAVSDPGTTSRRIFTARPGNDAATGVIYEAHSPEQLDAARDARIEVWAAIEVPRDRAAWVEALSAYEAAGATGVIVSWNARVLDLLRNPEPDDRTDLLISTG
ncbi:MAG: LLM class flavin-dependent oxidoreductase [Thermoplasmata archaeon]